MSSEFVTNDRTQTATFLKALGKLLRSAAYADIAVSYVKTVGWDHLRRLLATSGIPNGNIRLMVTDQFGITQPQALKDAYESGVSVRNYVGDRVYHPKVYLASDSNQRPVGAIVGSANLSDSALTEGVEAGILLYDKAILKKLKSWFERLYNDSTITVFV
jgi:HKD family nuclease